jgi:uncharacterized protein YciI
MLFCLRCTDRTDVPGLRQQIRPKHLEYLTALGPRIVCAGPLLAEDATTSLGSLLIVEAPDRAGAEALAAGDPYAEAGLFAETVIQPFRIVFLNPPAA